MKPDATTSRSCLVCGQPSPILRDAEPPLSVCADCRDTSASITREMGQPAWEVGGTDGETRGGHQRVDSGALLARRFKIARFVGSGGMGEVFEAVDVVLDDRVAVKVVHSERAGSNEDILRLRREVQLARRVTHSNVCRLFDLIQHQDEQTGESLDLVSMELLEGETLSDRKARQGHLTLGEALPIFRQVARGLHAAHRHGIVHRDLKPGNVMLVEEADGMRAVITDFGLAHRVGVEGLADQDLTESGQLIGTPAYMAPEQAAGEPTSPATDIYAFGTMLFEMLSGRFPFVGESPWLMVAQRLTDDPLPLARFLPGLDPRILDLVDRCLRRDPAQRFASMGEILAVLDLGDAGWDAYGRKGLEASSATPPSWTPGAPPFAASSRQATQAPGEARESTDDQPTLELKAPTIPRKPRWQTWAIATVVFLALGLTAVLWLRTGPSGAVEAETAAAKLDPPDWDRLQDKVRAQRSRQRDPSVADAVGEAEDALRPDDAVAQALGHLALYEAHEAHAVLRKSLSAHPKSARLRGRIAEALWREGREAEALGVLAAALQQASTLTPQDRLDFEGLRQGLEGDWTRAAETFAALWALEPTEPEHGFRILEAHWLSGQVEPAEDLLTALRSTVETLGESEPERRELTELRLALWQARFAGPRGELAEQRRLAQRVADAAGAEGHRFLQLEALRELAVSQALAGMGAEYQDSVEWFSRVAQETGEAFYGAHAHLLKSRLLGDLGREPEALQELALAETTYRELGSRQGHCQALWHRGRFLTLEPSSVIDTLEQALTLCSAGGFGLEVALATRSLGLAWRLRGDLDRAIGLYEESEQALESLGQGRQLVTSRISLALLFGYLGQIDEMLATLDPVDPWLRQTSSHEELVTSLTLGAGGLIAAGRLDEAETRLQEAVSLEPFGTHELDLQRALCDLAFARGDGALLVEEADALARLAEGVDTRSSQAAGYRALGLALEGREHALSVALADLDPEANAFALAWLGGLEGHADAKTAVDRFASQAQTTNHRPSLWQSRLLAAQVDDGEPAARVADLLAVEQEAEQMGNRQVQLEARLARGIVASDRRLLEAVRDAARELGFGYVVVQAERVLTP